MAQRRNRPCRIVAAAFAMALGLAGPLAAATLTIATVNNDDMVMMQKLSPAFEAAHPGIHLRWVVLPENELRQRVTADVASKSGEFDIVTVGNYEVPIWAKQGKLMPLPTLPESYDLDDLLKPVRKALAYRGLLYALPFYGESAMTFYRTDLFAAHGLTMPAAPTYADIRALADKLNDRAHGVYGICLRGKPGWGQNVAVVTSLVNAFGGQWFDADWRPTIDSPAWRQALGYYHDILVADGPPDAAERGFNRTLQLFSDGHCAIWIDATVAAGRLWDHAQSSVAGHVGLAPMPTGSDPTAPTWLWSWNLAMPASTRQRAAATDFLIWATSKDYAALVARTGGWIAVPPGTRRSTYDNPDYRRVAPFAPAVERAIFDAHPDGPTAHPRPYTGAQFVAVPEFQDLGNEVGRIIAATLSGQSTPELALHEAQAAAEEMVLQAGYAKPQSPGLQASDAPP